MDKLIQILQLGLFEGFVWFPFVLTMGLIYTYLKDIDVSIDGLVVISTVIFVVVFNATESFLSSFLLTIIVTILLYIIVHIVISKLRVNSLLTGIIISLILHSISVIIIGESIRLNYESLPLKFDNHNIPIFSVVLGVIIYFFSRTKIGVKVLISAGYKYFNSSLSYFKSRLILYIVAGFLLGIGAIIYSSRLGMARAGGGFEFLITTLCSFLFIEKLVSYLKFKTKISIVVNSVVFKSLVGSIIFQVLVFAIIAYLNNPIYWKLLFGFLLLLLVSDLSLFKDKFLRNINNDVKGDNLRVSNLSYSYDDSRKPIFNDFSLTFKKGINIIWGANGSGKSTLLNLIKGNISQSSGTISYDSRDISNIQGKIFFLRQNAFDNIGIDFTLNTNLVASSNLPSSKWLSLVNNYTSEFQNLLGSSLSGGQAQKFSLELCQSFQPIILLADEPTSGLDNISFSKFSNFLNREKSNIDIVIVTHDQRFKHIEANHINLDKIK